MMHFRILTTVFVAGVCACAAPHEPNPTYAPASRYDSTPHAIPVQGTTELSAEPVVEPNLGTLTSERCEREARCDHVGPARRWPTEDACIKDLRRSDQQAYGPTVCPTGIDRVKVSGCLQAVRDTDCQTSLDSLDDLTACAAVKVCRD